MQWEKAFWFFWHAEQIMYGKKHYLKVVLFWWAAYMLATAFCSRADVISVSLTEPSCCCYNAYCKQCCILFVFKKFFHNSVCACVSQQGKPTTCRWAGPDKIRGREGSLRQGPLLLSLPLHPLIPGMSWLLISMLGWCLLVPMLSELGLRWE